MRNISGSGLLHLCELAPIGGVVANEPQTAIYVRVTVHRLRLRGEVTKSSMDFRDIFVSILTPPRCAPSTPFPIFGKRFPLPERIPILKSLNSHPDRILKAVTRQPDTKLTNTPKLPGRKRAELVAEWTVPRDLSSF